VKKGDEIVTVGGGQVEGRRGGRARRRDVQAVAEGVLEATGIEHGVGASPDTLKPEYADALRRIEIGQVPVKDHADENGISPNNAGVTAGEP